MSDPPSPMQSRFVAPGLGAWIEIAPPVRKGPMSTVAPGLGAWIEIVPYREDKQLHRSRSRLGSVD